MGLFGFLKKDNIENENKSKPFHQNSNQSEIKDWFSRTRPWHKVDPEIIDALIRLYGDNPMFEVFVITSMENNLVEKYGDIGRTCTDPNVACSVISGILIKKGAQSSKCISESFQSGNIDADRLSKSFSNAMNLLESSIIVDRNQIDGYVQLASLLGLLNKKEEALDYIRQGLDIIKHLNENGASFHESSIPEVQGFRHAIDESERMLLEMKKDLM